MSPEYELIIALLQAGGPTAGIVGAIAFLAYKLIAKLVNKNGFMRKEQGDTIEKAVKELTRETREFRAETKESVAELHKRVDENQTRLTGAEKLLARVDERSKTKGGCKT